MTTDSVCRVETASIDPRTRLGRVRLRVRDLDGMTGFYELAIGLRVLERDHDRVTLGAGDGPPLVELLRRPRPTAARRDDRAFHLALLVPDRA